MLHVDVAGGSRQLGCDAGVLCALEGVGVVARHGERQARSRLLFPHRRREVMGLDGEAIRLGDVRLPQRHLDALETQAELDLGACAGNELEPGERFSLEGLQVAETAERAATLEMDARLRVGIGARECRRRLRGLRQ